MLWQCWSLTHDVPTTIISLTQQVVLSDLWPIFTNFSSMSFSIFWHLDNLATISTSLQNREVRIKKKVFNFWYYKTKLVFIYIIHNVQPQSNNHQNIWKYQISVAKYIHGKEKSPFWTACSSTFPSFQTYPAILAHAFAKSPGVFVCLCNTGQSQILILKGASHIGKEEK